VASAVDPRRWSLARQLLGWQVLLVLVVVLAGAGAAYLQAARDNEEAARQRVLAVAHAVAVAPVVRDAVDRPDPAAALQSYAEEVRRDTGTAFVVVMSPDGVRYTHPNPAEIGRRFVGHIAPAAGGRSFTETYTGTLGPSVRAVVPVRDGDRVRALVSVGIAREAVARNLRQELPTLAGAALVGLLVAGAGSWLVSRRLRRQTHDLGPAELARMYEFYDAVLHAVREGLLLLDRSGRVQLVNDEARRLLVLPPDVVGRRVDGVGLPPALGGALAQGVRREDEIHLTGDRVVVVNQEPARWVGHEVGTVVTLRDHTELQALTGELDSVRGFAESLRSQAHEAANRLHTVVSLVELGRPEQAVAFATAELAVAQRLTDRITAAVEEPVLAALLLGKTAEAAERGVELVVADDISVPEGAAEARDLVTIVGNLVDNAVDAAAAAPPARRVEVAAWTRDSELVIRVADSGAGLEPADVERAFRRGWSTKAQKGLLGRGLGLALVGQAVHRQGGSVEVTQDGGAVFTVRLPVPAAAR
jgi:sensor histidine kinase regulating citrate/malate metabolism